MPLWAGPQAPCACRPKYPTCTPFPHVFSSTPQIAQSEGVTEANNTANSASALGLAGTAVYYDMEQYNSSTCGAAVSAFISGWVSQLHLQTNRYTAGIYGAAADAQADWSTASPLPDDVWIAQTPLSGKPPHVTIWGLTNLSDAQWGASPGSRIHQFLGNYSQTWGGVPFSVDTDIENATIAANNGAKTHTYTYTSIDYPGATQTWAAGINDMNGTGLISATGQTGAIVGYYHDSSNIEHGFLYANGTFSSLDYPSAPDAFALGINNSGQIVGGWCDSGGFCHGFLRSAAGIFSRIDYPGGSTFTQANGINDAGQIVGAYHNSTGFDHGFLHYGAGQFYTIDAPGATQGTEAYAINGDASIAGRFATPYTSFVEYAFPPTWSGSFTSFNYGGGATSGYGIDNDNELLGTGGCCGFLLTNNVVVTTFQYPGATSTSTQGVNDFGQIVGSYRDSSGNFHGFLVAAQ